MAEYNFFIVNTLLLIGLVSGATFLHQKYDADTMQSGEAAVQAPVPSAPQAVTTNSNVQISAPVSPVISSTSSASVAPAAPTVAPAPTPKPAPVPKPTIRRRYTEESDDN